VALPAAVIVGEEGLDQSVVQIDRLGLEQGVVEHAEADVVAAGDRPGRDRVGIAAVVAVAGGEAGGGEADGGEAGEQEQRVVGLHRLGSSHGHGWNGAVTASA
jgi:hypothetical protein